MNSIQSSELINAKNKEIQCIGSRAAQRIQKIINIINNTITDTITIDNPNMVLFKISDAKKKKIISHLMGYVRNYNGTASKITASLKPTSYKKLRAFWNHKKAEKYGDYLFSVILSFLFQHIVSIRLPNMILLFIDIFCNLLQETIKFARTKSLPLICCSCFIKQNKFKQFCVTFLEYFGDNIIYSAAKMTKTERINGKSRTKYVRDSGRAKKQHGLYLQCLIKLRKQLQQLNNNRIMQSKIKRFQKWIIENKTTDKTNINPISMSVMPSMPMSFPSVHSNVNIPCNNNFIFQPPTRIMNNVCTQNIGSQMISGHMGVQQTVRPYDCCCSINNNQFGNIDITYPRMHDQLFNNGNNNRIYDNVSTDATYVSNSSNSSINNDNNNNFDDNLPPRIDNGFVGSVFDDNMSQSNFIDDTLFGQYDNGQYDCNQSQQQIYI